MRSQGPDGQAYQAKDSALDLSLAKLQPLLFIAPVGGHPLGTQAPSAAGKVAGWFQGSRVANKA